MNWDENDLADLAAGGAQMLDNRVPGWAGRINLELLDMRLASAISTRAGAPEGACCILAPLYGSYNQGFDRLGFDRGTTHSGEAYGLEAAFDVAYDTLDVEWAKLVKARLS